MLDYCISSIRRYPSRSPPRFSRVRGQGSAGIRQANRAAFILPSAPAGMRQYAAAATKCGNRRLSQAPGPARIAPRIVWPGARLDRGERNPPGANPQQVFIIARLTFAPEGPDLRTVSARAFQGQGYAAHDCVGVSVRPGKVNLNPRRRKFRLARHFHAPPAIETANRITASAARISASKA